MFKNLKTSTKISLKFTLFTMLQVLLFSIFANGIFFQNWYNREHWQIPPRPGSAMMQKIVLGKNRAPNTEIFDMESPEGQTIVQSHRWESIAKVDDMYFMYKKVDNQILVTNVTPHVLIQINLIWISIYLMIIFWAIAYILSRFFVKSSLKKLNELNWFLDHLHIDNLNEKITISGHPQDEINRISKKFNEVLEKIHNQTLSLKDFVTNASHELKTPLMSMSTEIDYTLKNKKYEEGLGNLKAQLKWMNAILETLVTISKLEVMETLKTEKTDVNELVESTHHEVQNIYKDKSIAFTFHAAKRVIHQTHKESLHIIIKNILDNAFKFTPNTWTIEVSLDAKKLVIKDNGKWIDPKDLERIRERFWQADRSNTDTKSFGLWLYLTKLLVEKHGRSIAITSKLGKWTTCTITF